MHDTKERLSLLWIFALLNYLYADVLALFAYLGSPRAPHLPPWALWGSAVPFVLPLTNGAFRDPIYPAYVWFSTIETVCTSVIIWQAWTWSGVGTSAEPIDGREITAALPRALKRPP